MVKVLVKLLLYQDLTLPIPLGKLDPQRGDCCWFIRKKKTFASKDVGWGMCSKGLWQGIDLRLSCSFNKLCKGSNKKRIDHKELAFFPSLTLKRMIGRRYLCGKHPNSNVPLLLFCVSWWKFVKTNYVCLVIFSNSCICLKQKQFQSRKNGK